MRIQKTILMIVAFATTVLVSTFVFAKDDNVIHNAGSAISNVAQDAGTTIKNGVENVGSGIKNGVQNVGNGIKSGASAIGNTMENGLDKATATTNNNNNNYTAKRTNTETGGFFGMGPIAWTWFSLALAGIIIVALVWYYGNQKESHYNKD